MLLAILLISPVGVVALFAFARFADRTFRDNVTLAENRLMRVAGRSPPHEEQRHAS